MNHDYQLPTWFWDDETTDHDRHVWLTQDRCRRQAMRQDTPWARAVRKQLDRQERRLSARSDTVGVEEHR